MWEVCHSSSIIIIFKLVETSSIQLNPSSQVASFVGNSAFSISFHFLCIWFSYKYFTSCIHPLRVYFTASQLEEHCISIARIGSGFKFRWSLNFWSVDGETAVLHSENYKFILIYLHILKTDFHLLRDIMSSNDDQLPVGLNFHWHRRGREWNSAWV